MKITKKQFEKIEKYFPVQRGNVKKDIFIFLKNYANFEIFYNNYSCTSTFTYDICFNNWPLDIIKYGTDDFKAWFEQIENAVGDENILYRFWYDKNQNLVDNFIYDFIHKFNTLAEQNDVDILPPTEIKEIDSDDAN